MKIKDTAYLNLCDTMFSVLRHVFIAESVNIKEKSANISNLMSHRKSPQPKEK